MKISDRERATRLLSAQGEGRDEPRTTVLPAGAANPPRSLRRRGSAALFCCLVLFAAGSARAGDPTPSTEGTPTHRVVTRCPIGAVGLSAVVSAALREHVAAPKKEAWERSFGGQAAARPRIRARLEGWPATILVDRATLPRAADEFVRRVAGDTWRGLAAFTDRESGLPIDTVRLSKSSTAPADARIGDYASSTDIGLHLIAIVAARELQFISPEQALAQTGRIIDTLEHLERYRGFFFNYYDTTSLERTSNFVSFVDSSWLTAGLIVVRSAFPELADRASGLIAAADYGFFYDADTRLISHGYYVNRALRSPFDYGALYTEARLGSLIAIGKGDVPEAQWFAMARTYPADCSGQTLQPEGVRETTVRGYRFDAGYYSWGGARYVPSWGGSMFEALMPTLVLDEMRHAPRSLGANDQAHAAVQERYARNELGYPVWGISPSSTPGADDYGEYGVRVLGSRGYGAGVVTPHASALAITLAPDSALANLRALAERYDIYGEYGFYDAVDPTSGAVAYKYLALDQSMLFIALANHLCDHCIQRRFAADPIVQRALPVIAEEHFFE